MFIIKYIISIIYKTAYKVAKRQTTNPERGVKMRFSLSLSLCLYLILFVIYKTLSKLVATNLILSVDNILKSSLIFIIALGILFYFTLNFQWLKNIELNRKQKNISRVILLLIITVIIFFHIKTKNY